MGGGKTRGAMALLPGSSHLLVPSSSHPEDPLESIPQPLIDALRDRYVIDREVGAGGMATVYLAQDRKHGRSVALKVLRPEYSAALGIDRFLREIEIAASITHPHVLPLHDSGEAAGYLYYVMPFVDGESLRERMDREGAVPIPEAVKILRELLEALGAAHARGVVHRDVKPENVLLASGHAWVADFGVARAVDDATTRHKLTTAGVALGTPQYMSPEQASADPDVDHRADLFAAGAVAYELLTGVAPFAADTTRAVLTAVMTRRPEPPAALRAGVPEALSDLILALLEKEPADRPGSAEEVVSELDRIFTPAKGAVSPDRAERPSHNRALVAGAIVLVAVGLVGGWWWWTSNATEDRLRADAIPAVLELLGENQIAEAARLAVETEATLGSDPLLDAAWPRMAGPFRVVTEPAGATVFFRPYGTEEPWDVLGTTPYETDRFPVGAYRFRIEADGYETTERVRSLLPANQIDELFAAGADYLSDPSYVIDLSLSPEGTHDDGMVDVPGGLYITIPVAGFGQVSPTPIPAFRFQRTEVTVAAYREFVEAGAYEDPSFWDDPFARDGSPVSWADAMAAFRDATDRPGPAGWSLGRPAPGSETLPVGGISWYEAAAYCRWRGLSLPSLYHWARASIPSSDPWIPFNTQLAARSNFNGEGPAQVASLDAVGVSGAHDVGGNVREWTATASGNDRFLVGGGWSDPVYWIHDTYPASPWRREAPNGVRCAQFPDGMPEHLRAPIVRPPQDLDRVVAPMSESLAATRRSFYAYDKTRPLATTLESSEELAWGARREWVTIDAAYGDRMPIRLHIPTEHEPPFEAIIFFGGGNVVRSSDMEDPQPPLDELVRSGRVLVEPAYDGTFQRNDGRTLQRLGTAREEIFANWIKDLGRTIDYLAERPDVDHDRVSFLGISLGSAIAPDLLSFEPRFRGAILLSGGFGATQSQRAIDQGRALAGLVEMPILMMGGRGDYNSPIEPHQRTFFESFGTPEEDKFFRVYDAGHWPLPMNEVVRETVDFLDRYAAPR